MGLACKLKGLREVIQTTETTTLYILRGKHALWANFSDVFTKLSKLLDPAHVTPRVKLCIHTKF